MEYTERATLHAVDVHIGKRLRLARTIRGWSQQVLAEATGLTFQQIQKYERGTNRMSGSRMWQLSRVLGVTPLYFYSGLEGISAYEPMEIVPSRLNLELIKDFNLIPSLSIRESIGLFVKEIAREHRPARGRLC